MAVETALEIYSLRIKVLSDYFTLVSFYGQQGRSSCFLKLTQSKYSVLSHYLIAIQRICILYDVLFFPLEKFCKGNKMGKRKKEINKNALYHGKYPFQQWAKTSPPCSSNKWEDSQNLNPVACECVIHRQEAITGDQGYI